MSESMTGINITDAGSVLNNFSEVEESIINNIANVVTLFCEGIVDNWASPNAKKFANKYDLKMIDLVVIPKKLLDEVYNAAYNAAMEMAQSNGAVFSAERGIVERSYSQFYGDGSDLKFVAEEDPNGVTGMNIAAVKMRLDAFVSGIKLQLMNFESLPKEIALYDPSSDLRNLFNKNVNDAIQTISSLTNEITKAVNTAIETEQDAIISGVNSAIGQLSA